MPHISNDVTHKQRQTNTPWGFVFCSWLNMSVDLLCWHLHVFVFNESLSCRCLGASRTSSYQSKHGGDDNSWYLSSVRLIRKPQWGVGVDYTASWVQQLLATNSRCLWVGGWILHFEIRLKTWISSSAHSSKWCCSQLSLVEWQGLVNIDLTQIG